MGFDVKEFVTDRDNAMAAFVMTDDRKPVLEYCDKYEISIPEDWKVFAAGVYKAVQVITTMPDEVKKAAAMKCMQLGFTPFIMPPELAAKRCETCRHDLGGGYNNCSINLEAECASSEYEAWEPKEG